jgi:hypothetical protein
MIKNIRLFSLINRFPIVKVVLRVPNRTMSTIVLTAFGDNRSLGLIKFPAALFIIKDGKSPNTLTQ